MAARDPQRFLPLPTLSYYVLLALGDGAAHGWAVIKRIRELTDQAANPSSGSLYLAMVRLQDDGLIADSPTPAGDDARRRYYRLTPLGREVARAESQRLERLLRRARALDLLQEPK
ncbi:MAG TPA: PadR family transcriptional regulator [Gemmatimonadaceae bacterium]|nr:PadR family transcriptional regulator [Gemmatimonadaceae bacterium]